MGAPGELWMVTTRRTLTSNNRSVVSACAHSPKYSSPGSTSDGYRRAQLGFRDCVHMCGRAFSKEANLQPGGNDPLKRFTNVAAENGWLCNLQSRLRRSVMSSPLAEDSQAFTSLLLQQNALQMVNDGTNQLLGNDNWP